MSSLCREVSVNVKIEERVHQDVYSFWTVDYECMGITHTFEFPIAEVRITEDGAVECVGDTHLHAPDERGSLKFPTKEIALDCIREVVRKYVFFDWADTYALHTMIDSSFLWAMGKLFHEHRPLFTCGDFSFVFDHGDLRRDTYDLMEERLRIAREKEEMLKGDFDDLSQEGRTQDSTRLGSFSFTGPIVKFHGKGRFAGVENETQGARHCTRKGFEMATRWSEKWSARIVGDGSIDGREFITAPAAGREMIDQLLELQDIHTEIGSYVNKKCGAHVHVDIRDLNDAQLARVIKAYSQLEDGLFALVTPDRRSNSFCNRAKSLASRIVQVVESGKITTREAVALAVMQSSDSAERLISRKSYAKSDFDSLRRNKRAGSRYFGLNLCPIAQQGSVEFRLWNAAVKASKLGAIMDFSQAFVTFFSEKNTMPDREMSPKEVAAWLIERLPLLDETRTEMDRRLGLYEAIRGTISDFAPDNEVRVPTDGETILYGNRKSGNNGLRSGRMQFFTYDDSGLTVPDPAATEMRNPDYQEDEDDDYNDDDDSSEEW